MRAVVLSAIAAWGAGEQGAGIFKAADGTAAASISWLVGW